MFFLKSLVYTVFSPSFYKEALGRGGKKALLNFFLFSLLVTILTSLYFVATFGSTLLNIPDKLGDFPDVSIENGELTMNPEKLYDFTEGGMYIVIDTTGSTTEIPDNYSEGVLLTQDLAIFRSAETPTDQEIPYDELLNSFDRESFSIDRESLSSFLQTAGMVIVVASPLFIFLGTFLGQLFSILLISLLGFIVLSAMSQTDAFKKSFILSLYAVIPVFYITTMFSIFGKLLDLVGLNFSLGSICCLIPIIFSLVKWGIFWGIGAYGITREETKEPEVAEVAQTNLQ